MTSKDERDEHGYLTDTALAIEALENNGCDCGTDEPGTCLACRCEKALRSERARVTELTAEVERLRDTLNMIECETQCEDAAGWARAALAARPDTRTNLALNDHGVSESLAQAEARIRELEAENSRHALMITDMCEAADLDDHNADTIGQLRHLRAERDKAEDCIDREQEIERREYED